KKYDALPDPDSRLRQAVRKARVVLWAVSTARPPGDLRGNVNQTRAEMKVNLRIMRDRYNAPAPGQAEERFKNGAFNDGKEMSRIVFKLNETLEELRQAGEDREKEPLRWQANYDFVMARLLEQIVYLEEYQALLGQMRKELPARDPELHSGWRLASSTTLQGDAGSTRPATQPTT